MKDFNFARFAELARRTVDNLIIDLGIWVDNLVARLNGESAPQHSFQSESAGKRNRSSAYGQKAAAETSVSAAAAEASDADFLTAEREDIAEWLKKTKFRTKIFMGVDEVDVWRKIGQLNRLYDKALLAERARYDALLRHYMETVKAQQSCESYKEECEVEDEYSEKGEQLPTRQDNPEKTAECSDEAGVHKPVSEDSDDSAGGVSGAVADVPDNAGTGEQHVSGDKRRRPDDRLPVRARVRKG